MTKDDSRIVKDPICGKDVDTLRARAVGIFGGVTYYFCSAECKAKYQDPRHAPRTNVAPLAEVAPPARAMIATDSPRRKAEKAAAEKAARAEADKVAKAERSGNTGKVPKVERGGDTGKVAKVDRPDKTGPSDKSGRFAKVDAAPAAAMTSAETKSGRQVFDLVAEPSSHDEMAEELTPIPTRGRRFPLLALLLLALLVAGGVVLFTLKHK
jgi:YHS domain-containing protein